MKQFNCSFETTYHCFYSIMVNAENPIVARRIANRWAKGKYWQDAIYKLYVDSI